MTGGRFILYILLLQLLLSCYNAKYFYLPEEEKFIFTAEDSILYMSNSNNFDTLFIESYYLNSLPDRNAYPYYYESQSVKSYFLRDKDLVMRYDSIDKLNLACEYSNNQNHDNQYCDSLYNADSLYMRIYFNAGTRYPLENRIKWKIHPKFKLHEYSNENELTINDVEYHNVFILERQNDFNDSTILFKRLFFNHKFGVLRYENINSEIFELIGKL